MLITKRSLYYWILHRHYKLQFFLLLIIITSLFFRIVPLEMQKRIINEAIELKNYQLLFLYCGIYFAAVLLAGISKYAINYLQVLIGQKILVEIRTELYRHILQLPLQFYRTMQPGTVISAMTAELNAIGFFIGGALAIPVTSVLTYLALLGYMFSVSPLLALLSSSFYPLELIIIPWLQKRYNRWNRKRIHTIRKMNNVINEAMTGIQDVQSYSGFHFEEQRLQIHIKKLYTTLKSLFVIKYGIKFTDNLFQSFGPLILFLIGGVLAIRGQFTLGALVAFLSAYEKIYDPWKEMLAFYQSYQDTKVRYHQIMKIFDLKPVHALMAPEGQPIKSSGKIKIDNVSFCLPDGTRLLNRVNLSISPGEQIAVVGFSGSGKSTMALLIDQLCDVSEGRILFDTKDISTLSKAEMSNTITMVSQKPFIFTGTILDNLLYGVKSSGQTDATLPDNDLLFRLLHDVGFEEDVLWLGINSVVAEDKVHKYKHDFIKMREIIHMELGDQFEKVVEFYDVNKFLYYATLRDNLIFGDSLDGSFNTENLAGNETFIRLLRETGLENELLTFGLALARVTLDLLQHEEKPQDPVFLNTTPIDLNEIDIYRELINRLELRPPQDGEEKTLLLLLSLRYIPTKHTVIALPRKLEDKIFIARHYFLKQIMGIDITACHSAGLNFLAGSHITEVNKDFQDKNFIAYCPTRYLYHHSLRTNILFGSPKRDNNDIVRLRNIAWKAFREHGLLKEVLSIGLDFNVGSQGSRLSGGQQQKIAIARALLKNTPILILDEATSGLDNNSQARIQTLLTKKYHGKTTVIAIIHRLDLARYYDRIVVMKNGSIVEEGSYETLMEQQGNFYTLINCDTNQSGRAI